MCVTCVSTKGDAMSIAWALIPVKPIHSTQSSRGVKNESLILASRDSKLIQGYYHMKWTFVG